ncbi:MAG: hypothetical protein KAT62_04900 [Desulfuromonadales bacterium]|nr:hypothetical protein [Desulfuromonadales bacterium]
MSIKEKTLATLNESSDLAEFLEMTLRFQGKDEEADKIAGKREEILRKTEDLLALAMSDWLDNAQDIHVAMDEAKKQVQNAIKDIEKDVKVTQRVVKATEKLDNIIEKAAQLLT